MKRREKEEEMGEEIEDKFMRATDDEKKRRGEKELIEDENEIHRISFSLTSSFFSSFHFAPLLSLLLFTPKLNIW